VLKGGVGGDPLESMERRRNVSLGFYSVPTKLQKGKL